MKQSEIRFQKKIILEYNKWYFKNKVPFTIYCDFEAYNVNMTQNHETSEMSSRASPDSENDNSENDNYEKSASEQSKEKYLFEQKPLCWGMYIHSNYPELFKSEYYQYYGEDSSEMFTKKVEELQNYFSQLLETNIPMLPLTDEEKINFVNETNCYYCGKEFNKNYKNGRGRYLDKVKDHDHLNGLYRGAAHNSCNLNANKFRYNFVPFYFYNGSKYDFHLMMKDLISSEKLQQQQINVLCKTEEEYFSMQLGCIRILDAFRFFLLLIH